MQRSLLIAALAASCLMATAHAQTQSPTLGDGASIGQQQLIGDVTSSADHTNSVSTQLGNSANANGATVSPTIDTRDQNTVTSTGGAATGGTAIGNQSSNDNRSSVGNTSSNSGGNITGGNTLANGGNTTTSAGGAGGAGGSSSSNGTNAQGQGQQQANNGTNAQGQTSANTNANVAGGNTGGNSANRNSQGQATNTVAGNGAGASAGAGAGSNNRTATSMNVDAADRSSTTYTSKTTVWAPVVHGAGAAPLAAANLVVVPGSCSPIHREIVSTKLVGKRFGIWGGQDDVNQGLTDRAEIAITRDGQAIVGEFIRRGDSMWGERVVRALAVVGTSSGASMSLGGFGKNGDGAQGGGAASGQLQQIAVHAWTEECRAFDLEVTAPEITVKATTKPIRE